MATLRIVQGDTAQFQLTLKNPDCSPIDLTSYGVIFTLKRSKMDSDAAAIFQGSILSGAIVIIGVATDGVIEVTIPHANTVLLRPGKAYYWDIQLKDVAGSLATPCFGTLYAVGETTDAT